jgi:hypothetical protein
MPSFVLEEEFDGMAPIILSHSCCDTPDIQIFPSWNTDEADKPSRTFTVKCPHCGEEELFTYKRQGFDHWVRVDD